MSHVPVGCPAAARVGRGSARSIAGGWALLLLATPLVAVAADAPSKPSAPGTPHRLRVSDPAVRPAGGGCVSCGAAGCRQGHGAHHHAGCREGVCVPYCPVRPQEFGFYGTQWRRWPGAAVVPVSGTRDAGPVAPPRSAVPGPAEESLSPPDDQQPADQAAPGGTADSMPIDPGRTLPPPAVPPKPAPAVPGVLEPGPEMPIQPREDAKPQSKPEPKPEPKPQPRTELEPESRPALEPKPEPEPQPKLEPKPEPTLEPKPEPKTDLEPKPEPKPATEPKPKDTPTPPPGTKPRPEDENLFEAVSASGWRARRRFPVGAASGNEPRRVEPATHLQPTDPFDVPPVPFDPAEETRKLRAIR